MVAGAPLAARGPNGYDDEAVGRNSWYTGSSSYRPAGISFVSHSQPGLVALTVPRLLRCLAQGSGRCLSRCLTSLQPGRQHGDS
jgi:hypothetical protein